ncbi:hypothetical protein HN51_062550, partial [Arachis hypogaea]
FKSIDKESSLSCCHLGLLSLRAMVVDSIQTLDPINTWSEQKVKLNDAEHKLKDQGHQLKVQQKRIGSTEKTSCFV